MFHVFFKVGDVNVLLADDGEFVFILHGVKSGVTKESDHGDEKLGADDVHFRVAMGDVYDTGII